MEKSFNLMMFRLHQSSRSRLRPGMTKAGLSSGQPKVLLYVRDHDACRMKDVSQYCSITPRVTESVTICEMKKDETDPSPFPALTQLEVWGTEI